MFINTLVAISKKLQIRARKNRDVYNCFVIVDSEGLSNLFYKTSADLFIRISLINQRNKYVIVNKKSSKKYPHLRGSFLLCSGVGDFSFG